MAPSLLFPGSIVSFIHLSLSRSVENLRMLGNLNTSPLRRAGAEQHSQCRIREKRSPSVASARLAIHLHPEQVCFTCRGTNSASLFVARRAETFLGCGER